jgi:hypothetical protein
VKALCEGAATLVRLDNRIAALALLWAAVGIAPDSLAAHRRLAAALANSGDLDAAAEEHARYIELLLKTERLPQAALEFAYARATVGPHRALEALAAETVPLEAVATALALPVATPALPRASLAPPVRGTAPAQRTRRPVLRPIPERAFRAAVVALCSAITFIYASVAFSIVSSAAR